MSKRKVNKKKITKPVDIAKAKLRGVFGAARSRTTYNVGVAHSFDSSRKKSTFNYSFNASLLKARQEISTSDYVGFLKWTEKQKKSLLPVSFNNVKPTLASLSFVGDTKEIPLISEISWLAIWIYSNKEIIFKFLKFRDEIEQSFWDGDLEAIYATFSKMKNELGQSVWLVEARLSVEQMFKGLESQKKILEELRNEAGRGFIRFISHRISMRNEPAVTSQRFSANIELYIANKTLKSGVAEYLRYKLCHEIPTCESDIAAVLRFKQNHSIIDCYEGLVNITQELIGIKGSEPLIKPLLGALVYIGADDIRVKKLEILLGVSNTKNVPFSDICSSEYLLNGNPGKAMIAALRRFDSSKRTDIFQLFVASAARSFSKKHEPLPIKTVHPKHEFVRLLGNIISKNPLASDSFNYLERSLRNFYILPSCKAFMDLARREHNPLSAKLVIGKLHFSLNNATFSPFDAPDLYLIDLKKGILVNEFISTIRNQTKTTNQLLPEASYIAELIKSFQQGENNRILEIINLLKESDIYHQIESRFKPLEVDALISLGKAREAIKIFGKAIAQDKSFIDILPFDALVNPLTKWPDLRQYANEIELSILLHHTYKINPIDALATLRRTAVDIFIRNNGLTRPSDVADHLSQFGVENVVYFFKNICISSVLDMCKCLNGTKAVDEERLRILGALIELDPDNSSSYETEILSISSTLRIREGIKVVDGSRIHVDLEGISRWVHTELQESLSRYKSLVNAGVGVADNLDDVLKEYIANANPKSYLDVPKNEADDIVVSMLWDLRERFLFDKPHGLNSYLSKRVRHNSIAGYLRGALDNDSLITSMSGGVYRENTHWRNTLNEHSFSEDEIEAQLKTLEEFGSKFDSLTSYLKNSVLHIRRPDYPQGIIELQLTVPVIHMARSSLQSSNYDLGSWFDVCVASFWLLLQPSLSRVREILSTEYKAKFIYLFDNLRADLVNITGRDRQCPELTTAITNASAELQKLIDRAADWFNQRQGELSRSIYTLQEIIDISIQSALARHKSCRLTVEKNITQTVELRADALVVIADILLIVIGNITEHSGCREDAHLKVIVKMDDKRSIINMRFESKATPEAYKKNFETISAIKADILSGTYIDKIAHDYKSGLCKIASIVKPENGGRIDFDFQSPELFFLDIDLAHTVESIELSPYEIR
ncbi:hypothetical protein [Microvirgula aerodenitrificans]|uniref:hypothetical protein n=1 Tax=Microvirgula aerodenitrificans TaxID=57480 RepID=UPI00131EF882|nr:hypothetical protein [Microvirgula aerodenitrificans]